MTNPVIFAMTISPKGTPTKHFYDMKSLKLITPEKLSEIVKAVDGKVWVTCAEREIADPNKFRIYVDLYRNCGRTKHRLYYKHRDTSSTEYLGSKENETRRDDSSLWNIKLEFESLEETYKWFKANVAVYCGS